MATINTSKIIRAPGRLIADPTTAFLGGTYPYGGVQLGLVSQFALMPLGTGFTVWHEGRGEPGDLLEASKEFAATCLLRGWDDDALEKLLEDASTPGAYSGHAVWSEPTHTPGESTLGRARKIVFVPDAPLHAPAVILYRAVPDWDEGTRLHFSRKEELGMPVMFTCVRDSSDRILKVGRLVDLPI